MHGRSFVATARTKIWVHSGTYARDGTSEINEYHFEIKNKRNCSRIGFFSWGGFGIGVADLARDVHYFESDSLWIDQEFVCSLSISFFFSLDYRLSLFS